jgi:hypothetical protein
MSQSQNQEKTQRELLEQQLAALDIDADPTKADMRAAVLLDLADCAEVRLFTQIESGCFC